MRRLVLLVIALAAFICSLSAQTSEANLRARLISKPLYLRGLWQGDKLHFDSSGQLIGSSKSGPFTVSGVEVRSLELKPDHLILRGDRAGLEFEKDQPKRVQLGSMRIEIAVPQNGDYMAALDSIFAPDLAGLVASMPALWQPFARRHFVPPSSPLAHLPDRAVLKPLPGATYPRVLRPIDYVASPEARSLHYSGTTRLAVDVDIHGVPSNVVIAHPAGLGLDESAAATVLQYRFSPAMKDGQPVDRTIVMDLTFQIF